MKREPFNLPVMEGQVTISYDMLKDLCHDAGWRITGNRHPKSVTVYHRYHGNSFDIEEVKPK